ncbi:hypothetical protein [Pontiella sp.]|uniref:hypothetical protein n=1 Tax=Pontiella sp. TaxID=2837462 RepID=UPI003568D79C
MKHACINAHVLRISALGAALGLSLGAQAATITQIDNNSTLPSPGESWLTTNDWDGPVNSPGNDYVNHTSGWDTRTPVNAIEPSPTFLGDSLTITNGARLKIKHTGVCTINDLRIWAGSSLRNGGVGGGSSMAGNMALKGTGSVEFNMEASNRKQIIDMLVTADPTIDSIVITSGSTFSNAGFTFNNATNVFSGTWDIQKGLLDGIGFGSASFNVGSSGTLNFNSDFDGPSSDLTILVGGVVVLDQDITVDTMTVWGTQLDAGTYTGAELKAEAYGSAFDGSEDASTITVLSGPVVVTGDTIYQTADMPLGVDWNDPAYWDNGLAPISTNDYVNDNGGATTNGWGTRTPGSGSGTFGGNSLTLTNNAKLNIKSFGPWTINNLNVWAGSSINSGGPSTPEIAGGLNLRGNGSVYLDAQVPGRMTTISSLITADAGITNIIIQQGQTAPTNTAEALTAGFILNGPLNTFDGVWVVKEGLLKGTGFGSGSFLITDMGVLDFDSNYVNASADLTVEANPTNAAQNGRFLLDVNVQVGSATLGGISLPEGSYTGADLKAAYGAVIHEDTSDIAILAVGTSAALPVYQTANQPTGPGWTDPTTWDNNMAPTNLFDYINNNYEARTPNVANPVFPGLSFTIIDNGYLKFRHSGTATITNLTMYAGTEIVAVTGNQLDGDLALKGSGSFSFDTQDDGRTLTIHSAITADSTVTGIVITCSNSYVDSERNATGTTLTDTGNTFTGTWIVDKGYLSGPGLGQGSFHVRETGYLSIGAAYSNETADLTIDVNSTNSAAGGRMLLEYDMTVSKASIWGTQLDAGEYTGAYLKSTFGDAFDAASSDTAVLNVTFIPDIPEIGDIEMMMNGTDLVIGFTATNYAVYTVLADDDLVNPPAWPYTIEVVSGTDGPVTVTNGTSGADRLFYKVEAELE